MAGSIYPHIARRVSLADSSILPRIDSSAGRAPVQPKNLPLSCPVSSPAPCSSLQTYMHKGRQLVAFALLHTPPPKLQRLGPSSASMVDIKPHRAA